MSEVNKTLNHDVCDEEINGLKGLIESQEQTITNLLNTLDGKSGVVVDDSQIKVKDAEIKRLESEVQRLKNNSDTSKKELENTLIEFNNILAEEGLSVEEVVRIINARDETIKQIANQSNELANELIKVENDAKKNISSKNATIKTLESKLESKKFENNITLLKYASIPLMLILVIGTTGYVLKVKREKEKEKISKLSIMLNSITDNFNKATDESGIDLASIDSIITLQRDFSLNAYVSKDIEYYNM